MRIALWLAVVGVLLGGRQAQAGREIEGETPVAAARIRLEALASVSKEERRDVVIRNAPVLMVEALGQGQGQASAALYEEGAAAIRAHLEETDPDYTDLELAWWLTFPKGLAGHDVREWTPVTEAALEVTLAVAERTESPVLKAAALLGATRALIGSDWRMACTYANQAHEIEANWVGLAVGEVRAMGNVADDLVELLDLSFGDAERLLERVARDMPPCPISEADLLERAASVQDADSWLVASIPLMLVSTPGLRIVECNDSGGFGRIIFERVYWEGYSQRSDEGPGFSPWGTRDSARRKAAREALER